MLGATTEGLERRALPDLVDERDRAAVGQLLVWARRGQLETSHAELSLVGLDGRRVSASVMVGMVQDGDRRFVLALVEDRTAQRALTERLAFAERYDELTGLLRRAAFVDELGRVIRTPRVTGLLREQPWVLALDLDGFTEVNDGLGHTAGDLVLTTVAERLRSALRGEDLLARIGADEFAVLVQDSNDAEITVLAERLVRSTTAPVPTPSGELFLSMSVGAAGVWTDDVSPEDVLRNADTALHRAKSSGRGRVELHRAEQRQDASKRVRTGNELHRAIERRELLVHYQPIIDLVTGCLKGFEALVRWQHPERGIVGPGEFIDLAESTGLIVPLGQQVMDEALRRLVQWRASSTGDERGTLTMSVNLSTRQLAHPDIIAMVRQSLDTSGVDPTAVILELTESAIMADQATARAAMIALRATGARLAIDDFGTGYSSLSYLQQFPVSVLKIDRGFVRGLGTVAGDTAICEAVIRLGHSLGLAVVAEGIEDDLQHRRLHELGCDFGQGYLFGRPLSQAQVEAAFERRSVFGPIWALRPDRSV
jgi:diguanylate cyclase (GGDEF)-like protein